MSIKIKNNQDISCPLPIAGLANCVLSFAFQLDGVYVTSNMSGLLIVKTQKDGGRITTLKTISLATTNNTTILGVYSNLYFTLTNAIGFDTLVVSIDQCPNIIGDIGGNSSSDGTYRGTYDASNNTTNPGSSTPGSLQNGVGQPGDFYITIVAGTDNPTGALLNVGEVIKYNGSIWQNVGSINGTDDIAVSPDYVALEDTDVAVGQSLTTALGGVQGNINTIKTSLKPIGINSNTNIYSANLKLDTPATYVNIGNSVITTTFLNDLIVINPPGLGTANTVGFNPGDVFTFIRISETQVMISSSN